MYVCMVSFIFITCTFNLQPQLDKVDLDAERKEKAERKERRRKIMEENQATTALFRKHLDKQKRSVMGVSEWVNK